MCEQHGKGGEIYNISSCELTAREIADSIAIKEGLSTKSISLEQCRDLFCDFPSKLLSFDCAADSTKARTQLHWQPEHINDALQEMLA